MDARPRIFHSLLLGVLAVPFLLLTSSQAAGLDGDSAGPRRSAASLSGVVVSHGATVANALVTDGATGQSVRTDARGRFVLSGLPLGARTLSVATEDGLSEIPFKTSNGGRSRGIISIGGTAPGGSAAVLLPVSGRGRGAGEFKGPISSIDAAAGMLAIHDAQRGAVTLSTNGSTVIRHGNTMLLLSNLTIGLTVDAKTSSQNGGVFVATEVDVEDDQGETEDTQVSGTVKSFDCNAGSMVLTTDSGDVTVTFDVNTVFESKGQPAVCSDLAMGDDAEVEGTLQGDGSILAAKVSFEPPEVEDVEVQGTVKSVTDPSFVVTTDSGDVTVVTDINTTFEKDGNPASFADVVQNAQVEAEGVLQNDASVLASKVKIESGDNGDGGSGDSGSNDSGSNSGSGDGGGHD